MNLPRGTVPTIDTSTAAKMADATPQTIRRWAEQGELPSGVAAKFGGRWKFDRERFLDWIAQKFQVKN